MPKSAAAIATTLVLLTSIVSWQLINLAATRPNSASLTQSRPLPASPALPESPQVLSEATIETIEPAISPRTPLLERLTLEQFARVEIPSHGGAIIMVESGNLRVQESLEESAHTVAAPSFSRLAAGHSLTAPPRSSVIIANMELYPASLLLLTIPPFDPADERWAPAIPGPLPAGVTREMRMTFSTIVAQHGPLSLSMRRMQIAPGAAVAGHLVAESEMILVESGSIEVQIRKGEVLPLTHDTPASGRSGTMVLSDGHGVVSSSNAEVAYRTTSQIPAVVLQIFLALV